MKRFVAVMSACALVVLCSGCGDTKGEDATVCFSLDAPFQSQAEIEYGETEATAVVSYHGENAWDVEFSEPASLSGVKLSFLDDEVTASYKGLSFSVPQSALPVKSMLTLLFDVLTDVSSRGELDCTLQDGQYVIAGEVDAGKYTLMLDKDGNLVSFEMPNQELTIAFSPITSAPSTETDATTIPMETTTAQSDTTPAAS